MKKSILLCCLCISLIAARAQYVAIPDSGFAQYLTLSGYASCVSGSTATGWRLDTACAAVTGPKSLQVASDDITGIAYLTHLDSLLIYGTASGAPLPALPRSLSYLKLIYSNVPGSYVLPASLVWLELEEFTSLDSLAPLPSTLIGLTSDGSPLGTALPALPDGMRYLNINHATVRTLPATLPDSLRYMNVDEVAISQLPPLPLHLDTLICGDNGLHTLPSLPASLRYLDCKYNQIDTLPTLPAGMTYLDCRYNSITNPISYIPSGMVYLDFYGNNISSIPAIPATVQHLGCGGNPLTLRPALPAGLTYLECSSTSYPRGTMALPATLTYLSCAYNSLTSLPTLPAGLTYLDCSGNPLHTLPALPAPLVTLTCDYDSLTVLPALHDSLASLDCYGNQLTALSALPLAITKLQCSYNLLTAIPAVHDHLTRLYCHHNLLASLPAVPAVLEELDCRNNPNLYCLPYIHRSSYGGSDLINFYMDSTSISCVSNQFHPAIYDINPQTLPLCTPASGCDIYYNILGDIHLDTAPSCNADSITPGHSLQHLKVFLTHNMQVIQQSYISDLGQYSFKTDSLVSYEVSIDSDIAGLVAACPASGSRVVALSAVDSVVIGQNFGLSCASHDVAAIGIYGHFRPGSKRNINIIAGNQANISYGAKCAAGMPGVVTTILSGPVQYIAPSFGALTPTSVSGRTLTYAIPDLDSLRQGDLYIIAMTDSTATVSDQVCITSIVTPSSPDANSADDTLTDCFDVTNSLDPNHKSGSPFILSPDGGWVTYTVEFQNTGNDTAYTVVVRDTLSSNVDASSFQYIASSHKAVVQLTGNAMTFTFPRINLVDSATDALLSEGWIQYKVKTKPNLPLSTQIKNTAYIYFDLNPAVVTNTTVNTVTVTSITPVAANTFPHLYPNPNNGTFTMQTSNRLHSDYTITDMLGNVTQQKNITANNQSIDMGDAAAGVYTLTVKGAQPIRFVVVR